MKTGKLITFCSILCLLAAAAGQVLASQPTGLSTFFPCTTSMVIKWTPGIGAGGTLVVVKAGSAVSNTPVDGTTYTPDTIFGNGDELVTGSGEFVVYLASGSSVRVDGLTEGTTYYVAAFSYTWTTYETVSPLTGDAVKRYGHSYDPAVVNAMGRELQCDDCHISTHNNSDLVPTGAEAFNRCTKCHRVGGPASAYSMVDNHIAGTTASKTGTIDCGTCHDLHNTGTSDRIKSLDNHSTPLLTPQPHDNLSYIRSDMTKYVPGASDNTVFQQDPIHLGFAQNNPDSVTSDYNGVCQTCHTQTRFHTRTSTTDKGHNINNSCTPRVAKNCTSCHAHSDGRNRDTGFANKGHTGNHFGWTTKCATCHSATPATPTEQVVQDIHGNRCDLCHISGGPYNSETEKIGDNGDGDATLADGAAANTPPFDPTLYTCQTCHNPGAPTVNGINANRHGAIHHDTPQAVTNNCTTCHTSQDHSTMVNDTPANCSSCHTATAGGPSGIPTDTQDALVHDSCITCHTFDPNLEGIINDFTNSKGVNGTGSLPDGGTIGGTDGGGSCKTCHTGMERDNEPAVGAPDWDETNNPTPPTAKTITYGGDHHKNANAQTGNCGYCHVDPRPQWDDVDYITDPNIWPDPDYRNLNGTHPKQLACRRCHVNFDADTPTVLGGGSNDLVISENWFSDGFSATESADQGFPAVAGGGVYDSQTPYVANTAIFNDTTDAALNGKEPHMRRQIIESHRIPALGNSKITVENFGICLSCHDGIKATAVNIWHARQKYSELPDNGDECATDNTYNMHFDILRRGPGRPYFNLWQGNMPQQQGSRRITDPFYSSRDKAFDQGNCISERPEKGLFKSGNNSVGDKRVRWRDSNDDPAYDAAGNYLVALSNASNDDPNDHNQMTVIPCFTGTQATGLTGVPGNNFEGNCTNNQGSQAEASVPTYSDLPPVADTPAPTADLVIVDSAIYDGTSLVVTAANDDGCAALTLVYPSAGTSRGTFIGTSPACTITIPLADLTAGTDIDVLTTNTEGFNVTAYPIDDQRGAQPASAVNDGSAAAPLTVSAMGSTELDVLANDQGSNLRIVKDTVGCVTKTSGTGICGSLVVHQKNIVYVGGGGSADCFFTYEVRAYDDCGLPAGAPEQATVFVRHESVPVAYNDDFISVEGGSLLSGDVSVDNGNGADYLADPPVTFSVDSTGLQGTLNSFDPASGAFTYTPPASFSGPSIADRFSYTITDATPNTSNTATVTILVNALPQAVDDSYSALVDTAISDNVTANDDTGDGLGTVNTETTGLLGTLSLDPATGAFTWTPPAGWTGTTSFSYTLTDTTPDTSNPATVTFSVTNNNPPVAGPDSYTFVHDSPAQTLDVLINDNDGGDGGPLSITAVTTPSAGGTATTNSTTILYTPPANFAGTETFQYTLSDTFSTVQGSVTVTLTNNPPTAVDDIFTVNQDTTDNVLAVTANDSDPDNDAITLVSVTTPSGLGGTATISGNDVLYTPPAGTTGTTSFSYTISDGIATVTATVTVTVTASAVTWDASSGMVDTAGTATTFSWNHTAGVDVNYLVVGIAMDSRNGDSVSSVTYPGATCVQLGESNTPGSLERGRSELWGCTTPSPGTANVTVTVTGNPGKTFVLAASSWNGVGTVGTPVTLSATTQTPSVTVATGASSMVVDYLASYKGTAATPGASQTAIYTDITSTGGSVVGGGSYAAGNGGNVTMSWDTGGTVLNGLVAVELAP